MALNRPIDVEPQHLKTLQVLLAQHVPGVTVWAFGSRVKWTSRPDSDLDLVVFATQAQHRNVYHLKDALEESNLPFRVDVLIWDVISEAFRENIRREYVVLVAEKEKREGFAMTSDWHSFPLEDCLDVLIDYRGKTPEKTTTGIPLITAKVIKGGRIETPTEFIAFDNYDSWMRRGIPKCGDVVLTVEAPLGEVAQLGPEKIALAQRVVTLRGKSGFLDSTYLLYWLQSEDAQAL